MRRFFAVVIASLVSSVALAGATVPSTKLFDDLSIRVKDTEEVDKLLSKMGELLKSDRKRSLLITVHADERPGLMSNVYLADQRARRLEKELKKHGARGKQLFHESVGHNGVERSRDTSLVIFEFSDDAAVKVKKGS